MRRLLVMAVTILAIAPVVVEAKCMPPGAFISPRSGTTLPPNPVLHVFVPKWMVGDATTDASALSVDLSADGASVASHVEVVSRAPAFWTYRVAIAHASPAELRVTIDLPRGWRTRIEASYAIGEAPSPPATPARATGRPKRESSSWTCSFQLTQNVPVYVEAPAYRLEWATSLADYQAGSRATIVFPRRMGSFFNWRDEPEPSPPLVEVGHVDCVGSTLSWEKRKRIWAGVWALQPDGTEIALNDQPIILSKP